MLAALIILPFVAAGLAALLPQARRAWVLPLAGAVHLALAVLAALHPPAVDPLARGLWLSLDGLGAWVLLVVSGLFLLVALYAPGYLALRRERPNRFLVAAMLAFLGFASLACAAQHPGVLWVTVEAATLAFAPLIYFNRNQRSLEATWKYLMVGAVGIAFALLGTFFLAYGQRVAGAGGDLTFAGLRSGPIHPDWLRMGFVLLLVGYGTKLGLAPLHTWKPDAYGETPGIVGALLSGGMTAIAFLALARCVGVIEACGDGAFARQVLTVMGLVSMAWAGVFMVRQTDLKRLLAYSSVEHMGILIIALALGPTAALPCLIHLAGNALTKAVLFLATGNLHRAFASKHIPVVTGAIARLPWSGALLLGGLFAVTGSPPFAPFLSEFGIISSAFAQGAFWTGGLVLGFLALIFIGLSSTLIVAVQGEPPDLEVPTAFRDRVATVAPPLLALLAVLVLGLWIPGPVLELMQRAAVLLHPAVGGAP